MSSLETLEKRTVSALSYFGLYKLHLANLYLAYAQTQPWTLNKRELHDVARSIIPTLSWKLDGTPITTAAHYRLAYSIIKEDPFIADDYKQVIYDAWQTLRWRTHLLKKPSTQTAASNAAKPTPPTADGSSRHAPSDKECPPSIHGGNTPTCKNSSTTPSAPPHP